MRNLAQTLAQPARPIGIDEAIGQIDLVGDSGEIVKSWRIRSPRCTVGSSPECSVQLSSVGIAPLHVTLIFGKKHTLLRSSGPTLISNRHVREWLIDHSTEIVVGQSRLIVHPSLGGVTTVVHAEHLIDQAVKLRRAPPPAVPTHAVALPEIQTEPAPVENAAPMPLAERGQFNDPRLDTIEQLLQSLQVSLEKMQASLCTEAKLSNVAIVESVSQEIDEFGKRLFTNLNDQFSKESGTQQTRMSELANQFTDQFDALDDRLNQFGDASSQHTSTLNELLQQATSEQEQIEARFQELISHRNELVDAVQVLRSEIAIAYESQLNQYNIRQNDAIEYAEAEPLAFDDANSDHPQYLSSELAEVDHSVESLPPVKALYEPALVVPSVTDAQLADSLEQAQIHIQDLNAQLRQLEMERDSAQQRVENLSESWSYEQAAVQDPQETEQGNPLADTGLKISESDAVEREPIAYESSAYESLEYQSAAYESDSYEPTADDEIGHEVNETHEAIEEKIESFEKRELPAWFQQQEPQDADRDNENRDSKAQSFSVPDLSSYSDSVYDAEYPSESFERSDSEVNSQESNDEKLDSISERLQRMLADADQRRGPAKPLSEVRSSSSWSQKFNAIPVDNGPISRSAIVLETADRSVSTDSENQAYESVEDQLASLVNSQEARLQESVLAESANYARPVEHEEQYSSTDRNAGQQAQSSDENPSSHGEEESIEVYMQRLLHRVRGGAGDGIAPSSQSALPPIPAKAASQASVGALTHSRSRVAASLGLDLDDPETMPKVEKLSEEMFMPRQQAPEHRNDLDALRELANTNARRAISRSDIRRTNSAFFVKMGVTGLAVISAVALFLFNGFSLNAPFAGMVSAIVVAGLWGYDCFNHFKLLKNGSGMHQATAAETAAGQSIRLSSSEENGWRPSQV